VDRKRRNSDSDIPVRDLSTTGSVKVGGKRLGGIAYLTGETQGVMKKDATGKKVVCHSSAQRQSGAGCRRQIKTDLWENQKWGRNGKRNRKGDGGTKVSPQLTEEGGEKKGGPEYQGLKLGREGG